MNKKTWVAPTVKPLTSAKDARLGISGSKDGIATKHSGGGPTS